MRYLHRYHTAVPPMALIAPLARVARCMNRSTPYHGDHHMLVTERYRGQGLDKRELRQAGDVVDLNCPPFFIDRVEDAVTFCDRHLVVAIVRRGPSHQCKRCNQRHRWHGSVVSVQVAYPGRRAVPLIIRRSWVRGPTRPTYSELRRCPIIRPM